MHSSYFRVFAGLVICLLPGACATKEMLPEPFDSVAMRRGGVVWQQGASAVKFEGVFARSATGEVALDLYKGGATPVATLRLQPSGKMSFSGLGHRWSGIQHRAPQSLHPLVALAALYGKEKSLPNGIREIHSAESRTALEVVDGRLETASVASQDVTTSASVRFW